MKIEEVPKFINAAINKLINKNTDYTLKLIEKRILTIQNRFFTYLVNSSGIIGASSTPTLPSDGSYRPLGAVKWPEFSSSYQQQKQYKYRTKAKKAASSYKNRFFINSGELKNTLKGLSATSIFGKPKVLFTPTNKDDKLLGNKRLGTISIDFFPKLGNQGLKAEFKPAFYSTFFGQKQTNQSGKKPVFVGMKLRAVNKENAGNPHRPFIGQYMQWWVKVKAKQAILKGVV